MDVDRFLGTLNFQTSSGYSNKNSKSNAKKKCINKWRKTQTLQYQGWVKKTGESDAAYLGYMFARAGITREDGLQFVKKELGIYYGDRQDLLEQEFDSEFLSTQYDSDWDARTFAFLNK